ncbi:MAG: MFS transporter [Simkaniaceae bacterium]|nr:MFS transporter [Simkaniaceae bacterium]
MASKKILAASVLGNALEFYDFTLYGVLALVLSKHYFPGSDDTAKLLCSLAAFAVGFVTRPFGALLFGHLGDTLGRKESLSLSILLMGVPTFLIGVMPTYQTIGLFASISVFFCRLLQGIFTGGEYNGAAIFSIEHFGQKSSGFIGGVITGSCVIGAMAATLLGAWSQGSNMPEWAWRIPFVLGGAFALLGYFIRRGISETPDFTQPGNKLSFLTILRNFPYPSFVAFMCGGFNGALTYTLFGFLNIYLSRYLGAAIDQAIWLNLFGLFAFLVGSPFFGYCLDTFGKTKYLQSALLAIFLILIPIFKLLNTSFALLGQILLGLCAASIAGSCHALMQELFPVNQRCRGISVNFSLGMGLFGGITPIVYVHLIERQGVGLLFPPLFLMGLTICFGLTMFIANIKSPHHAAG